MGISDKTMGAAQDSDPEVQKMMLDAQQNNNQTISEPVNKPGFFERLLNYAFGAGASEPDNFTVQNLGTGFNTVLDQSGNIQIVPVQTNNDFPFKSMTEFAQNNNMVSPANVTPFDPKSIQSIFPTNLPVGITQSTAAKQFEEPFRIINGQKVYISDVIGTKQAEEKANFFQEPPGS